jgi:hypothetical protein
MRNWKKEIAFELRLAAAKFLLTILLWTAGFALALAFFRAVGLQQPGVLYAYMLLSAGVASYASHRIVAKRFGGRL